MIREGSLRRALLKVSVGGYALHLGYALCVSYNVPTSALSLPIHADYSYYTIEMRHLIIIVSLLAIFPLVNSLALLSPWQNVPHRNFTERECMMCRFSVSLASYALKTQKGADQVYRITNNFCALAHIESPIVCSSVTKLFNQEVVKVLSYALITPDQVCGYLSNNTCGFYYDPWADWEVNLNVSASLDQNEIAKMRAIEEARREPRKPYKVIHISDTHVDLNYKENSEANCEEPLCCQATSKVGNGTSEPAGYWGSYSHCDVPLRTFESALKVLKSTLSVDNSIDYIIWTGDIQPHDVWNQSKQTATLTYESVFSKIFDYLPKAKIFPTFGNHEMIPVDSFSPSNLLSIARDDSPEWVYRKLDSYWSRWLPEDTVQTITKDGFYSVSIEPGLKIISINTNFCHNKNFWLYINSTDPGNQLQWLVHELQLSELEHEQVHIIGHIPPGVDDCLAVWSKNFNKILRRFSRTVSGQFYGHTHYNEFEIFYDHDGSEKLARADSRGLLISPVPLNPISVGHIGPSITTFIDVNPAFRIYTIDPSQGFMPIDFETIFMNLTLANSKAVNEEPKWESTGPFTKLFGLNDTSPPSMHNLVIEMVDELIREERVMFPTRTYMDPIVPVEKMLKTVKRPSGIRGTKLYQLYRLLSSYSDKFSQSDFDKLPADKRRALLCGLITGQSHNHFACDRFIRDNVSQSVVNAA